MANRLKDEDPGHDHRVSVDGGDVARRPWRMAEAGRLFRARARLERWRDKIGALFAREFDAGRGFLWLPVGLAAGIGLYFSLPREPQLWALAGLAAGLIVIARRARRMAGGFALVAFVAAGAIGLFLAKAHTALIDTPRLAQERTVTVLGWVEAAEASGARTRVTLRVASISGVSSDQQPRRVRLSMAGAEPTIVSPGTAISVRARLGPPQGPVIPGGYDFARGLFFDGIGATGFSLGAPKAIEIGPPPMATGAIAAINHARRDLALRIGEVLAGDTGAVAAALAVGLRRGISPETEEALRQSGLAHILAISGLHMALVCGAVFAAFRAVLALFPSIALRYPIRSWAALAALAAGALYLALSGAGVATQRAFIMVAIVFLAVVAGRPAVTMRTVAVAALLVMALKPVSVVEPGFQMSFAAVVALVAIYEVLRDRQPAKAAGPGDGAVWFLARRFWLYAIGLALTSLIAGLATAPYAAFHFHRVAPFGLLANMLAMPIVAFVVMPVGVLALVAMPFGLDPLLWPIVGWGIDMVTAVSRTVAGLTPQNAVIGAVPVAAIILVSGGLLWLALWQTRLRLAGIVAIAAGIIVAGIARPPDVLISADGRLAAVRDEAGRLHLSAKSRNHFLVENWLRAVGDPRAPPDPTLIDDSRCDDDGCIVTAPLYGTAAHPVTIAVIRQPMAFAEDCRRADIVVTSLAAPRACALHTLVFDRDRLATTGAIALRIAKAGDLASASVTTALPAIRRPWHPPLPTPGAAGQ